MGVMSSPRSSRLNSVALGTAGVLGLAGVWEGYKALGNALGGKLFGWRLAGHTDDASMPHIATIIRSFTKREVDGKPGTVFEAVLSGTWLTLRLAVLGFIVGVLIGLFLAILMERFRVIERAWLPYVVLSQTVPLIALAPLLVAWTGRIKVGDSTLPSWVSVAAMAGYLAFFPVAIGALKGLQSPKEHSLELMQSYAASSTQTLLKLRFPSAIPFLLPALKLAAAASVVGAVVAEISLGKSGGIGRLILDYFQKATGDPARVFTAFVGAAALGLIIAGLVGMFEKFVMRNRPKEQTS
jgi:NitT/TauT family transport system permease protein